MENRIRELRKKRKLTMLELGEEVGVGMSAISNYETGKREPSNEMLLKLAEFFNVSVDYLIGREPSNINISNIQEYKPGKTMPVLGRIAAGLPLYAEENIEGFVANDFEDDYEYYALRVYGDSMTAAGIDDGDLVIVRKQDTVEDNQIAVVIINGYDATIKFFKQKGRMVFLSPKSFNPKHSLQVYDIDKDAVRVLGRVIQIRKDR